MCLCSVRAGPFHSDSTAASSSARKPTHHPSRMTTSMGFWPGWLTAGHCDCGIRSPSPENAALSYCGNQAGSPAHRPDRKDVANEMSCVPEFVERFE